MAIPNERGHADMKNIVSLSGTVSLVLLLGACSDLTVPDLNNPSVDQLGDNPTRTAVATATQGLMRTTRDNVAEMVKFMGAFGREGYPMSQDGAELVGTVANPLNGANFPGNTLWDAPYRNIRDANLVLEAVGKVADLSEGEKEAVRGFTKTVMAYDFLNVVVTRDLFGAPIDVNTDPTGNPAPFVSREAVYDHVIQLLDEGRGHLQSAGSSFPFQVTSGLSDFSTPSAFLQLNRGLRARVAAYVEDWPGVMSALSESFVSTSLPLGFGAYHVFSTNSGDAVNPLNRPDFLFAHPRIRDDAQTRENGELDLRAQDKVRQVEPFTVSGITSDLVFTVYSSPSSPLAWIRNEELILLRAEARLQMDMPDLARQDINYIRTESGGLEPLTTDDPAVLLDELLYNRFYSLLWEYGHNWIDMRRYERLDQIPTGSADPRIFRAMPIPESECTPRSPRPEGCGQVEGI